MAQRPATPIVNKSRVWHSHGKHGGVSSIGRYFDKERQRAQQKWNNTPTASSVRELLEKKR